jgi:hypothetical protein
MFAKQHQGGGKIEMCKRIISVELDAAPQPSDCLPILTEKNFGQSGKKCPEISVRVARRETERFLVLRFSLLAAAKSDLGETNT